ncbi:hypothetical protein LI062_17600, partial [Clostridium perfringens]|nr:hypothetical protein [Clostridium perfringens]
LTVELVENDIQKIKEEIKNKDNEIASKNKDIENLNSQISTLEKEKEYQTGVSSGKCGFHTLRAFFQLIPRVCRS